MNRDKLVLNDGSEIAIESGASLLDIRIISETKYDMVSAWDLLTKENLKSVQVQNSEGMVIGNYKNLVLESETSTIRDDGSISTKFRLREKTEVEILREEVESLKEGREVQDGAISDLGEAVSGLAEQGGLA